MKTLIPALFCALLGGTVIAQVPVANFSFTINGLEVQFTDLSTNTPTTWFWAFGDGGDTNIQNPVHKYPSTGGIYSACLVVSNSSGPSTNSACENIDIETVGIERVSEHPDLRIYPNPASSKVYLERRTNQQNLKFQIINQPYLLNH